MPTGYDHCLFLHITLTRHSFLTGAIFGTGTNGAYVEKVVNIRKLGDHPARKNGGDMVVNCEWGAFDNTVSGQRGMRSVY